ncbi:MAG: divergent PAP2 family protein [Spirochaetaceae bacterium]|jgi:acid phosphatase family membrane protein YuiD|nr:divergent PAP2 family protein [Spirochaetaceae bacterium]
MSFTTIINPESVKAFFENPIFLSALSSWFFSQLLKAVVAVLRSPRRDGREILATIVWRTGGMPSSHSALVSAMTASVAFKEGINSNLFVISFWITIIIMRDAIGVRRSSGLQGRALNLLGRNVAEYTGGEYRPLKEVHGHTPLEVVAGALLGVFIAAAYSFL